MNPMDSFIGCGAANAALARIKSNIPAWRYRYMGVWDNISVGPGSGAYHSADVPAVFGTTELIRGNQKDSEEEAKTIKSKNTLLI
jgi:carboxylesterase type B